MPTLTYDTVISTAANLVREDGWSGLSVRAVAIELGVTPMALYRHVPNSEALSIGVISNIAEAFADVTRSGDAFDDLKQWARQAHDALTLYPGAAGYLLATWFKVPPALRALDGLLELVHAAGIREFEAVAAVNAVFTYVLGRAEAEHPVRTGEARQSLEAAAQGDFPRLTALVEHYNAGQLDMHFATGLQVLIEGIANRASGRPDRRA